MQPRILLVNPPIYDFAAYDFWLKPYGLLRIGGMLRNRAALGLFDFMDRLSPLLPAGSNSDRSDEWGRGHFYSQPSPKPAVFEAIPRRFKRYGLPREIFREYLAAEDSFQFVLIGCGMTYWYPGVAEVIGEVRALMPTAKIVLGGIYPALCPDHAKKLRADLVITAHDCGQVWTLLGISPDACQPPLWELYPSLAYGVIKLSDGCPFNCTYCAAKRLSTAFAQRPLPDTLREYDLLLKLGTRNIAFYDDALLVNAKRMLFPFLNQATRRGAQTVFHTPNALHLRYLNNETAERLVKNGFCKIFMGVESLHPKWLAQTGDKTGTGDLERAVQALLSAGADSKDLSAYLIFGHPKQSLQDVEDTLQWVHSHGIASMLAEFSPIPGTPDGELCRQWVDLDEPLQHNNTAFTLKRYGASAVNRIKLLARALNSGG